ncbi:antibiotic abc transporter atp-binding protein : ABC transporter-like protein OS=Bacillus sp. 1NLA3E GN=B1NLA3E_04635 PE=3 SV=1: ABC_tran [Gemmata massiliana]|uniref:ABC transporter domain-containing protein n=1 Tax=Gemmata massiliana TaxID=1210884 RepID=A0A6P2D1J0_9BACT|nr:ABC transporter ATP-binding protein [Gemmata massiliana]VTR94245.1 antibiotic abc transporter atp-binding protein : ABC transporter-like protein OS=Bacillus sp. 1NLA3E GN=B1NLA3E_04635 PE=3 SV=1: ABC_tran [Gemmata massiliana]
MSDAVLEVTDIRKQYGETVALNGVSLTVQRGEVFGLLGPNGAGKTTLLSIAAGLTRADSGSVKLFGEPFTRDTRSLRHLVGIGTQDLSIYPDLTARENLRFFGKLYGKGGKTLESRVDEMLGAVGLTDRANDRAGTFSGGMKRRLNLAVAVVHAPKLLILDEPTTGVDPQSRNHIFEQVKALSAAGLTVIYTSHYMEEVQTLCKRIAVIDNGTLRACDTLPNLLKRLDTTVRVTVSGAGADFSQRLQAIPGVKQSRPTPPSPLPEGKGEQAREPTVLETTFADNSFSPFPLGRGGGGVGSPTTFEIVVEDIGPVLARVASECVASGADLTAVTTTEPTLERVFLNLTGRGLRD